MPSPGVVPLAMRVDECCTFQPAVGPPGTNRTHTRRQQRRHSQQCYKLLQSKLLALVTPLPAAAILASDLETVRQDLFKQTEVANERIEDLELKHGSKPHLTPHASEPIQSSDMYECNWCGIWQPLTIPESRVMPAQLSESAKEELDSHPGQILVKPILYSGQVHMKRYCFVRGESFANAARKHEVGDQLRDDNTCTSDDDDMSVDNIVVDACQLVELGIQCKVISDLKVMILSEPDILATTRHFIQPGKFFSAVTEVQTKELTYYQLHEGGFVPQFSRKSESKLVAEVVYNYVPRAGK